VIECQVTVRNPAIVPEPGNEGDLQEQDLDSQTGIFAGDDDQPLRNYYLNNDCFGLDDDGQRWGADSVAEATEDWTRFVRQRIDAVAQEGEETVFGRYPNQAADWCAVEGTLTCAVTETSIEVCVLRGPDVSAEPIATCPPIPPAGTLVSECDGQSPCATIGFPDTPIGQEASVTVTLSNAGEAGAGPVRVGVAGNVDPIAGPDGTFHIPVSDPPTDPGNPNTCHPSLGDGEAVDLAVGESCSFDVRFAPLEEGSAAAEASFTSSVQPERHVIQLAGAGLAGDLAFELPDLGPGVLPIRACFDAPLVGGCTPPRVLRITNTGPGDSTVTGARIEPEDPALPPGFEVAPAIPPEAAVVLSAGESLDLEIRWCEDAADPASTQERGAVVVEHDDPSGTFSLDLLHANNCPQGI
jgi:hypothetical protein